MTSVPPHPVPSFGRLAGVYRWMEWLSFGPYLGFCRYRFLSRILQCRRALVLGDGDGRFTARLLAASPSMLVHAIDGSPAMLAALTHASGANATRLTAELADLRVWRPAPDHACDLVVSHFFLDCLNTQEVSALASRVRPALDGGAFWVISEFSIPSSWFGRLAAAPIVRALYIAFGLLTGLKTRNLPDHAAALCAAGFVLLDRQTRLAGLLASELWQASHP